MGRPKNENVYLVRLLAKLVLSLPLEAVSAVHLLRLVISTVDVHVLGVQPCVTSETLVRYEDTDTAHSHLNASAVKMTSIDHDPRSTRSPFIRTLCVLLGSPVRDSKWR